MGVHRAAALVMFPVAVMVVLGQDVVVPALLGAGRRVAAWPPLLPLRRRIARLPAFAALLLFLVPELCSRCGTLASAWLLLQGDWWRALAVYVGAKLLAGGTALWIYTACQPALLRVRLFAAVHGFVAGRRAWLARPARAGKFAALLCQVRLARSEVPGSNPSGSVNAPVGGWARWNGRIQE